MCITHTTSYISPPVAQRLHGSLNEKIAENARFFLNRPKRIRGSENVCVFHALQVIFRRKLRIEHILQFYCQTVIYSVLESRFLGHVSDTSFGRLQSNHPFQTDVTVSETIVLST